MTPERWDKVRSLLEQVQRRDPSERGAFLDAVCRADPALGLDVISLIEPATTASSTGFSADLLTFSAADTLATGEQVGPYRIVGLIGQGGMGRVYQATDTRLERFVALKFVPRELERNDEIRRRFLEEAKVAAALDHPYICKIYEIGQHGQRDYIAMEYVEGQTLSERLDAGPVPLNETLRIAGQIAESLEKAHQKSVIHRDLKPQNIMLTAEGHVKLMDFGLARRLLSPQGDPEQTLRATPARSNILAGTLAYMSPEQFRGESVDGRADIFSFGIVLYEMLTGSHPFKRATKLETATAITEAPLPPYPPHLRIPPRLQKVVEKMLRKDPAERYQSIREIRVELGQYAARQSETGERRASFKGPMISAAIMLGLLGYLIWSWAAKPAPPLTLLQTIPLTSYPRQERWPALSPDGKHAAFSWNGGERGDFDVYVKPIGAETRTRLTSNPAQDTCPTWAPDGARIAFARRGAPTDKENGLFVVSLKDRAEKQLRAGEVSDPNWSADGDSIAFTVISKPPEAKSHVALLSLGDQRETQLTAPTGHLSDSNPALSPDGKSLAFARWTGEEAADIYVMNLQSRAITQLTSLKRPVFGLAWSPEGDELIFGSSDSRGGRVWRVPASGGAPSPTQVAGEILAISVSRRGNLLAFEEGFNDLDIWRIPGPAATHKTRPPERLITSTQPDLNPDYSPDGRRIAFSSRRTGTMEIWTSDANGQDVFQVTYLGQHSGTPRWSPDGQLIAFDSRPEGNADIFVVDPKGRSTTRLTNNPADDILPGWSRDGRWIYFGSDRTGRWEVFKVNREGGPALQITRHGGWNACESADGRFLYYLKAPYSPLWRASLAGGPEEVVINELIFWPNWKLVPSGIIVAKDKSFYLYQTNPPRRTTLATIQREPDWQGPQWIALSPDSRWLLYSSFDHEVRDIMLAQDFK